MSQSYCSFWAQQWSSRPGAADGGWSSPRIGLRHEAIRWTDGKQPFQCQQRGLESLAVLFSPRGP